MNTRIRWIRQKEEIALMKENARKDIEAEKQKDDRRSSDRDRRYRTYGSFESCGKRSKTTKATRSFWMIS